MIRRLAGAAGCAMLLLAACGSSGSVMEPGVVRVPDDAGVATDVTLERIQIDGERTYEISPQVESFTTRSHRITALLSWEKRYVHVGLDDDRAIWIAGIGVVSGDPPTVIYSGVLEAFDDDDHVATFEDGTTLTFADDVEPPEPGREIVVEIDVDSDTVTSVLD